MWKWLKPGLGLKRWFLLVGFGAFILALGLSRFLDSFVPSLTGLGYRLYLLVGLGLGIMIAGFLGLVFSLVSRIHTGREPLVQMLQRRSRLGRGPRIVALGGGTGLSTLLRGLKKITGNLTAVVAVTDDGGSSGRIREVFNVPAPGDLRNCLVALAPEEQRLSELFSYRFEEGGELAGHSVGNILMTAMADIHGGFPEAIRASSEVLATQGEVLPALLGTPELRAEMTDGSEYVGESDIAETEKQIETLTIEPRPLRSNPEAISAIADAGMIVVGPGSLYTSILTNFLEPDLCAALNSASAPLVYICNLMTQPGETDGFSVSDHLQVFKEIPPEPVEFDHLLVNVRQAPAAIRKEYEKEGAAQVRFDYEKVKKYDLKVHARNYLDVGDHLRHDVDALVAQLQRIVGGSFDA